MPITPYLNGATFDPEIKRKMGVAFELACAALNLTPQDTGVKTIPALRPLLPARSSKLPKLARLALTHCANGRWLSCARSRSSGSNQVRRDKRRLFAFTWVR
jgi:hypothetical protein